MAENLVDVDRWWKKQPIFRVQSILTRWLATDVGCVAIWPATAPNRSSHKGSGNAVPSRGNFSKSGQKGPRGRGRGRPVRFSGMNILYDEAGNELSH